MPVYTWSYWEHVHVILPTVLVGILKCRFMNVIPISVKPHVVGLTIGWRIDCLVQLFAAYCVFAYTSANILRFLEKRTPHGKIIKILFRKFSSRHRSTCCVQSSWNRADGKSVKSGVAHLTKIQNFAWLSSYRYCTDRTQNLPWPILDNVLRELQISSKSVHYRRSYSRTREHRQNAP